MKLEQVGFLDVASIAAQRNTCLVLPTLKHTIELWPRYVNFILPRYKNTIPVKTIIYLMDVHTMLAVWVPYEPEPTMTMDYPVNRREFHFVSPYGGRM